MSIIKTYQVKLKPTKEQVKSFDSWLNSCRCVYNMALEIKDSWYKKRGVNISKGELQKQITDIRKDFDWIKDVQIHTLQDVTDRLFRAYDNFFRRVKAKKSGGKKEKAGYPKFAKKRSFCSFGFKSDEVKLHANTNTIALPKIGKVKYRKGKKCKGKYRAIEGIIVHTRIIKKADGWYASVTTELPVKNLPAPKPINEYVANDLGLIHLIVDSNGYKIKTPKFYRENERKLQILQRSVSRKRKGSSNWKKAVVKLSKQYKVVVDSRKDFSQKLSSAMVNENQVIGFEDLNIVGMVRNRHLSKSILDAGWGMFMSMVKYKSEWYGRTMIKLNRYFPSSKKCSCCGYVMPELPLSVRVWTCPKCGAVHERDENASANLEVELKKAVGHTVSSLESSRNAGDNIAPLATSQGVVKVRYA
jgi:putative transposase